MMSSSKEAAGNRIDWCKETGKEGKVVGDMHRGSVDGKRQGNSQENVVLIEGINSVWMARVNERSRRADRAESWAFEGGEGIAA